MMTPLLPLTLLLLAPHLSTAVDTFTLAPGDSVALQSPNFPSNYPTGYRNQWEYTCTSEFDNILELDCPVFNLEDSTNCSKDRLVVAARGQREVKCGSDGPSGLTTATGWMRLTFSSNDDGIRQGFDCTISCRAAPAPTLAPDFVTEATAADFAPLDCGSYSLTSGQEVAIQTTDFPQPHGTSVRCQWEFSCPEEADHTLTFTCPTFDLESSKDCMWDKVILTSRGSRQVKCGTNSPDGAVTSSGWARVTFFSNAFSVQHGFRCYITCQAK